ncbi:DNA glycosylase [Xylariaceae sp. FL0255]|nr:DNA glycosylase [Xylariaceae sp. FL0255]
MNSTESSRSEIQKLAQDLLFGFDVEDEDDRDYLAEVALRRIGPPEDIDELMRLSLLQGKEILNQDLSCAAAMRERGEDHVAFLHGIYRRPDSPEHGQSTRLQKSKCKKSTRLVKLKDFVRGSDKKQVASPYWLPAVSQAGERAGASRDDSQSKLLSETGQRAKKESTNHIHRRSSATLTGGTVIPARLIPRPMRQDDMSTPIEGDQALSEVRPATGDDVSKSKDALTTKSSEDNLDLNLLETSTRGAGREDDIVEQIAPTPKESPGKHPSTPKKRQKKSPYFGNAPTPPRSPKPPRPPRGTISSIPFPRLDAPVFGLVQEELATDPFRLLIAVTFLIRTPGLAAIPTFRQLMARYPTPQDLASAETDEIEATIRHLGLSVVRAATIQKYARIWLKNPPTKGRRYGVKNYPARGDGGDVRVGEILGDDDEDSRGAAWEIGHLTQGPYAIDSWRIFCRDVLRGVATDWKGGGREGEFQPEWMRVKPRDKELRACLRWMWMQEGWEWDPVTGEKEILSLELRNAVQEGQVEWNDTGNLRILPAGKD